MKAPVEVLDDIILRENLYGGVCEEPKMFSEGRLGKSVAAPGPLLGFKGIFGQLDQFLRLPILSSDLCFCV